MPDQFTLDDFNTAPAEVLRAPLTACLAVPRWVDAVLAGRPYPDVPSLLEHGHRVAAALSDDEVRAALAGHPRIGERASGSGAGAAWSRAEQSGVDGADPDLADRLRAGNRAYEDRFGQIYLVCATGRSGPDLLADLTARLANDRVAELRVVNRELAAITRLRLAKVVA
jgi:2-oxo-4-hydroxy-4-carboxy-5-ureidoimidazoline decarboxylase